MENRFVAMFSEFLLPILNSTLRSDAVVVYDSYLESA
jgi:hypothetical protein